MHLVTRVSNLLIVPIRRQAFADEADLALEPLLQCFSEVKIVFSDHRPSHLRLQIFDLSLHVRHSAHLFSLLVLHSAHQFLQTLKLSYCTLIELHLSQLAVVLHAIKQIDFQPALIAVNPNHQRLRHFFPIN